VDGELLDLAAAMGAPTGAQGQSQNRKEPLREQGWLQLPIRYPDHQLAGRLSCFTRKTEPPNRAIPFTAMTTL